MSKYATEKTFDGRRARCGDIVILAYSYFYPSEVHLRAGVVCAILLDRDIPHLQDLSTHCPLEGTAWMFVATKTESDIEQLKSRQWTWPLNLVRRHAEGEQVSNERSKPKDA